MQEKISIDTLIAIAEEELAKIDAKRDRLLKQIETFLFSPKVRFISRH